MKKTPAGCGGTLTTSMIWEAKNRIAPYVKETPLALASGLSRDYNASIFLKLEFLQPTGSFKVRGACNKILSLSLEEQSKGVATFSTGNHGLAVAYIARQLNIPASIFVSKRVPAIKISNLQAMGVNLVVEGESQDDAENYCYRKAEEEGWTVVKPFDDPHVIAGQGTIGLELLHCLPDLDTVIVPLSGGGLISGIALALKSNLPGVQVIGVSMEKGAVMYHSLQAGKPVIMEECDTLADSLLGGIGLANQYTFKLVQDFVNKTVLVSEEAIARAMALLFRKQRIVVEGAAATTVAALAGAGIIDPESKVVLILSGNSIEAASFIETVSCYLE